LPPCALNLIRERGCGGVCGFREKRPCALEGIPHYLFDLCLRVSHEVAASMIQLARKDTGNLSRFFPQLVFGVLDVLSVRF